MYGVTPGIFKNIEAVKLVAEGFSKEKDEDWVVVVYKRFSIEEEPTIIYNRISIKDEPLYRPIEKKDLHEAESEGWKLLED